MFYCECCKERWFINHSKSKEVETICQRCQKEKKKKLYYILSEENDMDPFPWKNGKGGFPSHLPVLTEIEEMLIARTHVVMKCYRLHDGAVGHKGQVGYKGQCLNIDQDTYGFVKDLQESLPEDPKKVPVVWVRKPKQNTPVG